MRLRNNIFAAAFDYLKREKGIKTQKRLAELMGVSEDTITRILKDRCEVTEDIITKLQTASGCIFNLQWLRGEDPIHMLIEDLNNGMVAHFLLPEGEERNAPIDHSSLVNAALAAKDETINVLKSQVSDLRIQLVEKDKTIEDKNNIIAMLKQRLAEMEAVHDNFEKYPFPLGSAEPESKEHPLL
jgi:transcriptional regulator with XRE-family HTH domain